MSLSVESQHSHWCHDDKSVCLSARANVAVSPSTPWRRLLWSNSVCAALPWGPNLSASPWCALTAPVASTRSCLSQHVTVCLDSARKEKGRGCIQQKYSYPFKPTISQLTINSKLCPLLCLLSSPPVSHVRFYFGAVWTVRLIVAFSTFSKVTMRCYHIKTDTPSKAYPILI